VVAGEDQSRPAGAPLTAAPTFELERFAWGTPDRLEVSGTFAGLRDAPADASPFLVVRSGEQMHRLTAVPDSFPDPPEDGRPWRAAFAWQDAPVAFDVAELHLGADILVQLPEAGAKRRALRRRILEVHTAHAESGADKQTETQALARDAQAERGSEPSGDQEEGLLAAPPQEDRPRGSTERVSAQVEVLAAQEQVREFHAVIQQLQEELTRARDDLRAERERHAAAQERFREGLASVTASAEEALAVEQSTTKQLADELRQANNAIEDKDASLQELGGQVKAAVAARTQAESSAAAELAALRERVAELERAGEAADQLRLELDESRTQADDARAELENSRNVIDKARTDAERLLGQLTASRHE
jgi:hypothetical protein